MIDAIRDGKTFKGSFFRGTSAARWFVDAELRESDGFLELKGKASLYAADSNTLRPKGAPADFYATTKHR